MNQVNLSDPAITITGLNKAYASQRNNGEVFALRDFDLTVGRGELVTLFGPNGCGKSTLLRALAGLEPYDAGEVSVGGQVPGVAEIGFVFQDFRESLFPWRSALGNIAFPLEARGLGGKSSRKKAREFCEELGIRIPLDSYTYELSGGQRQMVAIARSLVYRPAVLLMDEAFSALDYQTNEAMEDFLLGIWEKLGMTIIFISHEVDQAVYLADRVALLTQAPARVAEEIPVSLPRPRQQCVKNSPEFIELRAHALDVFRREASM